MAPNRKDKFLVNVQGKSQETGNVYTVAGWYYAKDTKNALRQARAFCRELFVDRKVLSSRVVASYNPNR